MSWRTKARGALSALALTTAASPAFGLDGPAPGALTASTLTLPSGPASIRGLSDDPSVSLFSGQVSYGIPIELPKSQGELGPEVSLAYDGARGNGAIGLGWQIEFPRIRRSLRQGVPAYGPNDELELVGTAISGRLRPMPDGTFRVEGAGNDVRVQKSGSSFIVTDGNGVKYFMGINASGRQASTDGKIAMWMAQSISYPNGQSITLKYLRDQNEAYLSQMTWGPKGAYSVTLNYVERPDVVTSFRPGFKVVTAKRLGTLEVVAFGELLRRYELSYDNQFALSRLVGVTMKGRNGEGELPAVSIQYETGDNAELVQITGGDGWTPAMTDVALFDVEGDGLSDLVRFAAGDHRYYRNVGGSFDEAVELPGAEDVSLSAGTARLMDMTGDGRPELVRSTSAWQVYRLSEGGFGDTQAWGGTSGLPLIGPNLTFADLNGDGRTDMIERAGSGMFVRMNGDGGLAAARYFPSFDGAPLTGSDSLRFQDANGDELADAIRVSENEATIHLGKGDGSFDVPYAMTFPFQEPNLSSTWLADLNRDGVLDVVHVESGHVVFYPVNTDGRLTEEIALPRPDEVDPSARIDVVDVNGNGSSDVVWSTQSGIWCLDLSGASRAGMLSGVVNGMGKIVAFDYRASAELALEDELAGRAWLDVLPVSIPVAVEARTTLAVGDPGRTLRYSVRDGYYDGLERRFAGFRSGVTTSVGATPEETLVETTFFHEGQGEQRTLRGRAHRREVRDGTGKLFSVTLSQWQSKLLDGFPTNDPLLRVPRLSSEWLMTYEGDTSAITTRVSHRYDGQGNRVQTDDLGRTDRTGDETYKRWVYATNDSTWVRGRVVEESQVDGAGNLVAKSRTYYDGGAGAHLPLGQIDKGWQRKIESLLIEENRWIVAEEKDYDAFGNAVRFREQGKTYELTYDADGLYPLHETWRRSSGDAVAWASTWDRVIGQPLTLVNPDGGVQSTRYDSLGRPIEQQLDGVTERVYEYDWSRNRPRVTTYIFDGDLDGDGDVDADDVRVNVVVNNSAGEKLYEAAQASPSQWLISQGVRHDMRGRAVFQAEAFAWHSATLPDVIPATIAGETWRYDALGRVVSQTLATGAQRLVRHGAYRREVENPGLAPVAHVLDGQGRVVEASRLVGGVLERGVTTYNAAGQIAALSLQNGLVVHRFSYDSIGRLIAANDPDIGVRNYVYDDAGRVLRAENAEGQQVAYTYDDLGRVTHITGDQMRRMRVHYDDPRTGTRATRRTFGRPAWVEEGDAGDLVEFSYDQHGRVTSLERTIAGVRTVESSLWTPSGLLRSRSFDDGLELAYRYDRVGRTVGVGDLWQATELDPVGRLLSERYGNGIVQTYQRNALGLPHQIRVQANTSALFAANLTYTDFGALETVIDFDGRGANHSGSFRYDAAARLTRAAIPEGTFSYGYDGLQNMTHRSFTGALAIPNWLDGDYSYGNEAGGPRRLVQAGDRSFAYDTAGRMIEDGQSRLFFDAMDRLSLAQTADGEAVEHHYGYDGVRTYSVGPEGEERRYSPHLTDRNGVREHTVQVGSRVLARIDRELTLDRGWVEARRIYEHATVGDAATLITNEKGAVVDERRFEAFGAPIAAQFDVEARSFSAMPVDLTTGYADHGARWYAHTSAQWLAPDPESKKPSAEFAAAPWDISPYQYARQNPSIYRDPDGRKPRMRMDVCRVDDPPMTRIAYADPFPNIRATYGSTFHGQAMDAYDSMQKEKSFGEYYFDMVNIASSSSAEVIDGRVQLTYVSGTRQNFSSAFGKKVAGELLEEGRDRLIGGMAGKAFASKLGVVFQMLEVYEALEGVRVEADWGKASNEKRLDAKYKLVRRMVAEKGTSPVFNSCLNCRTAADRESFLIAKEKAFKAARTKFEAYRTIEDKLGGKIDPNSGRRQQTIRASD